MCLLDNAGVVGDALITHAYGTRIACALFPAVGYLIIGIDACLLSCPICRVQSLRAMPSDFSLHKQPYRHNPRNLLLTNGGTETRQRAL